MQVIFKMKLMVPVSDGASHPRAAENCRALSKYYVGTRHCHLLSTWRKRLGQAARLTQALLLLWGVLDRPSHDLGVLL